jgi:hypothetical protein
MRGSVNVIADINRVSFADGWMEYSMRQKNKQRDEGQRRVEKRESASRWLLFSS